MSEIKSVVFNDVIRAKTLLSMLEDGYSIFDTQNPTAENRAAYSEHCGEIYAVVEIVKDCVDKIHAVITE